MPSFNGRRWASWMKNVFGNRVARRVMTSSIRALVMDISTPPVEFVRARFCDGCIDVGAIDDVRTPHDKGAAGECRVTIRYGQHCDRRSRRLDQQDDQRQPAGP